MLLDFRPNLLANYLYELADTYHSFYEACNVLRSEGTVRNTRLTLCEATSRVLKTGLGLLCGIQTTERMYHLGGGCYGVLREEGGGFEVAGDEKRGGGGGGGL